MPQYEGGSADGVKNEKIALSSQSKQNQKSYDIFKNQPFKSIGKGDIRISLFSPISPPYSLKKVVFYYFFSFFNFVPRITPLKIELGT